MELDVVPEPDPVEREAIVRAMTEPVAPDPGRSAWWRRGVRENLGDEAETA